MSKVGIFFDKNIADCYTPFCSQLVESGWRITMRGTPEGRFSAGMSALYFAARERDNARRQAGQQNGLVARETWLQGYMFSEIDKQLSNITSVLRKEIPPKNYCIPRG